MANVRPSSPGIKGKSNLKRCAKSLLICNKLAKKLIAKKIDCV